MKLRLLALIAAPIAFMLPGPPGHATTVDRCAKAGTTTLSQTSLVRLYRFGGAKRHTRYACIRTSGKTFRFDRNHSLSASDYAYVHLRIGGRYYAYGETSEEVRELWVRSASSGRVVTNGAQWGSIGDGVVLDDTLRISSVDGATAWLERAGVGVPGITVKARLGKTLKTLGSGPIDEASLTVAGGKARWKTTSGASFSAKLP